MGAGPREALIAQLVEQAAVNRWVQGSSPCWGAYPHVVRVYLFLALFFLEGTRVALVKAFVKLDYWHFSLLSWRLDLLGNKS